MGLMMERSSAVSETHSVTHSDKSTVYSTAPRMVSSMAWVTDLTSECLMAPLMAPRTDSSDLLTAASSGYSSLPTP